MLSDGFLSMLSNGFLNVLGDGFLSVLRTIVFNKLNQQKSYLLDHEIVIFILVSHT